MKHLTLLILAIFTVTLVFGKCTDNGIFCLSRSQALNKNGLIILEFYGRSQVLIADLNKKYPIYLKSLKGKVELNVVEILKGEMQLTQIILKPVSELMEGEVYNLQIDRLPKYEMKPQRLNESGNTWEPVKFTISNTIDTESPVFNNLPSEQKKTFVSYGCGPARWVYFNINAQDKSELFVKAIVKNTANGKSTAYILHIDNSMTMVGHGMCSGGFHFESGDYYEVAFQLLDQSGNTSIITKSIAFTKPVTPTEAE